MDTRNRIRRWERWHFINNSSKTCTYCGAQGDRDGVRDQPWQIDHVVPVRRGGQAHDPGNLALACHLCNALKRDRLISELPAYFTDLRARGFYREHGAHIDLMLTTLGLPDAER